MSTLLGPRTMIAVFITALFFCQSSVALGSHTKDTGFDSVEEYNDWLASRSSTYRKNINKLDDDIVKKFAIPVLFGVTLGDITPNFGDPRGGGTRTHEGLDILAPKGVPIVTPTEAVVMRTGSGPSSGKYVYTANPGGGTFVYMHLDTIADFKTGRLLKVGDTIGTVGDTGNAKGTYHLHFEVKKNKPLDPYPRIVKEFTLAEKMKYLDEALTDIDDADELVELMIERFSGVLLLAQTQGIELHTALSRALKNTNKITSLEEVDAGLSLGDDSSDVVVLQTALIVANVGPKAGELSAAGATGYFGPVTKSALVEYQKAFGLSASGTFTNATKDALLARRTAKTQTSSQDSTEGVITILASLQEILKQVPHVVVSDLAHGAKSSEVSLVQSYLILHGKGPSAEKLQEAGVTGYFGEVTESSLKEFQAAKGIAPTGIYDAATRNAMLLS